MPTISVFYGIVITMHLAEKEHNPPHIHARYGEYNTTFSILDGSQGKGNFPKRATLMVKEFIELNKKELLEMWNTEKYKHLKGLDWYVRYR